MAEDRGIGDRESDRPQSSSGTAEPFGERIVRLETRFESCATKENLKDLEVKLWRWIVGAIATALLGIILIFIKIFSK